MWNVLEISHKSVIADDAKYDANSPVRKYYDCFQPRGNGEPVEESLVVGAESRGDDDVSPNPVICGAYRSQKLA
jgi:hypothetical protein